MTLTGIYTYPLKSGKAISMGSTQVIQTGLLYDRTVVVIDENDKVITGRDFPELTSIVAHIEANTLELSREGKNRITIALPTRNKDKINFKLFRNRVQGLCCDTKASDWVSRILNIKCRLAFIENNFRCIDPKRGGKENDIVGYADASPIHLISETSLNVLSSLVGKQLSALRFRPNLVVQGGKAFDEDFWQMVVINDCEFEVHYKCERCIFTTVDPSSLIKDEHIEPLATLAKFRKERNEPISFGIYLVPRKTGSIQLGNAVYFDK